MMAKDKEAKLNGDMKVVFGGGAAPISTFGIVSSS